MIALKGVNFPSLDEYRLYLESEGIRLDSGHKSRFNYIHSYFYDRELTEQNLRAMIVQLLHSIPPHKKSSVNKYIATFKKIAHIMKITDFDNFKSLKEDESEGYGELLSDKEMEAIANCYTWRERARRETNLRFKAAFTLMRFSGIPPDDLVNLTWENDKLTHFELKRNKTGRRRVIPIPHMLRILLDKLPRYAYVFGSPRGKLKTQSLRDELKARCQKLGYKKHITPYSFRYSFITLCLINGGEGVAPKISKIAGNSLDTAMKHYAKFNVQDLIDALQSSHPGLKKGANIDTIKRMVVMLLERLVDVSKYDVSIEIIPKQKDKRIFRLS